MKKKIIGIKKAVGDFQRANAGGYHSPRYGTLMLDRGTGEVWTDEFYSVGHSNWKEYRDRNIINLSAYMEMRNVPVNMANVRTVAESLLM